MLNHSKGPGTYHWEKIRAAGGLETFQDAVDRKASQPIPVVVSTAVSDDGPLAPEESDSAIIPFMIPVDEPTTSDLRLVHGESMSFPPSEASSVVDLSGLNPRDPQVGWTVVNGKRLTRKVLHRTKSTITWSDPDSDAGGSITTSTWKRWLRQGVHEPKVTSIE